MQYYFFRHIFFSSLISSFSFFTPSKRTQNSFTTTRQILDVFFILIFISIVIYSSLLTFNWLIILIYAWLFILMFFLYCCLNLIKLLKHGKCRNYDKIFLFIKYGRFFMKAHCSRVQLAHHIENNNLNLIVKHQHSPIICLKN